MKISYKRFYNQINALFFKEIFNNLYYLLFLLYCIIISDSPAVHHEGQLIL